MRAKAYPLLEQTITDGLRGYLLNRVNKHSRRVVFVRQNAVDGPTRELNEWDDIEQRIDEIAGEATDHILSFVCEAFTFSDDEEVVPSEDEPACDCKPQTVYPPDGGAEKIIRFLERRLEDTNTSMDDCVDARDWANAAAWEARSWNLTFLLQRIKADDLDS